MTSFQFFGICIRKEVIVVRVKFLPFLLPLFPYVSALGELEVFIRELFLNLFQINKQFFMERINEPKSGQTSSYLDLEVLINIIPLMFILLSYDFIKILHSVEEVDQINWFEKHYVCGSVGKDECNC